MKQSSPRSLFATRLGVIATTVGSAVGLGNIWRFPYEAGVHGGSAFLILYIAFILILGVPVLCAEFALGRSTHRGVFGAFSAIRPRSRWRWSGLIAVVSSLMILSFYSVVAGWTLEYFIVSVKGGLSSLSDSELHSLFSSFIVGWRPVGWTIVFLLINYFVTARGVQKGVERLSNILTPMLFILIIAFCINSLLLPGASEGLAFLFHPDFSKITPSVVIGAMGQAFFSLSLGSGVMLTYSSYFTDHTPIVRSAMITASLDTLIAILSGILIFPAVFTYGVSPAEGPTLVFEVLPSIFNRLPGGMIWSALFFFMLFLASLTSTMSMSECAVTYFVEEKGMRRKSATALTIAVAVVFGTLCALSFSSLSGLTLPFVGSFNIFNFFDYTSSNILLPVGGILVSVFVGRIMSRSQLTKQLSARPSGAPSIAARIIPFILCWVAPVLITIIFLVNL